jgi:glyoxylase-like metal-dependent hydrolase (beta-lactamase superfamily II)
MEQILLKEKNMKRILLIGLLLAIVLGGCQKEESQIEGVYSFKIGQFEVFTIVESERPGNTQILIDLDEEIIERFIPEEGFIHTANAFLVRAHGRNILIDTGTGAEGIIVEKIRKLGIEPEEIDSILITHLHGDHFGGLTNDDGEANFPNATVYVSVNDLEYFTVTNVNQAAVDSLALNSLIAFEPSSLFDEAHWELPPGISPIAAYGHTPGHTIFLIRDGDEKLLIIGDLLHVALVQFAIPEISAVFDVDPAEAAIKRRQVLEYAAANNISIGGIHIVYPGIGDVSEYLEGFTFTPKN